MSESFGSALILSSRKAANSSGSIVPASSQKVIVVAPHDMAVSVRSDNTLASALVASSIRSSTSSVYFLHASTVDLTISMIAGTFL